ncbi:MAG: hypothetical protein PCFJNLEI_03157 [Verrucomicrobiae bacterium]|nr:hypothetical protein [Verrucomicrobiae bacterium]
MKTVTIVGAGPAACTLAILLRRAGLEVTMFFQPKRAPLIVGESLVPAIIPILRLLGIEDEVKSFSQFKPGACFNISPDVNFSFPFNRVRSNLPPYAYNVPRAQFDDCLTEAARRAGTNVIEQVATLERIGDSDRVQLAGSASQPDLIVDATGRLRMIPNLLGLPSERGRREDTALFAHLDKAQLDHEGYVHTTRLERGWSWRIPLPGRVSLGCVVPAEHATKFGATAEEQYDNLLRQDRVLKEITRDSKRLTPVVKHTNYQLVTTRLVGPNWVLVGDTAGFIDPVFSSGLFIAMNGAITLADCIQHHNLPQYERHVRKHLRSWLQIVEYFYNGELFSCFRLGQEYRDTPPGKVIFPHMDKHMGRIFTGAAAMAPYSRWLLDFSMTMTRLKVGAGAADLAVA